MIKEYEIETGILTLSVDNGDPDELFKVEARQNPKRGFLFVSKVLGKHIPVSDDKLQEIYRKLSLKTSENIDFSKKTLVIGMAETATLLGFGFYLELASYFSNKDDISYIHSTRYPSFGAIPFEESHSHAPSQFIHMAEPDNYEQVILVDDELSTGNTFIGFEKILFDKMKNLKDIHWACITDFRKKEVKSVQKSESHVVSLLSGEWKFEWKDQPSSLPGICENNQSVSSKDISPKGRYEKITFDNLNLEQHIVEQIKTISPKGKVLILGTGEFMPIPYLVLKHIKETCPIEEIYFQATTRSPSFMKGFSWDIDHYKEGVKQYLYNYNFNDYDQVILCVETGDNEIVKKMSKDLSAFVLFC